MLVEGNIVDLHKRRIFPGEIYIENNTIINISENNKTYSTYLLPGFIDAHVHIESSMLLPTNFSDIIITKGTIAIINDPHEIANVLGIGGINFMIENSKNASIYCYFGIPSCVPATPFDYSGDIISSEDVENLAKTGNFIALSEVMNVPGVLQKEKSIIEKINIAKKYNLKIDGHAPLLKGDELKEYIDIGISTDHECSTLEEAIEKIEKGMKILIREGSATQNYSKLKNLIKLYPDKVMFCNDDTHPDDIIYKGHIDKIVKQAIRDGYDLFDILRIASLNPINHYKLNIGTLKTGEQADFIRVNNLEDFRVEEVYIKGEIKYKERRIENLISLTPSNSYYPNKFRTQLITTSQISKAVESKIECIGIVRNELITNKLIFDVLKEDNFECDISRDILKIVYLNRYIDDSLPQISYISGFGIKEGAFGSSIAHDSHNILAVGSNDKDIVDVINTIIKNKGGLCIKKEKDIFDLPLPIGGIISDKNGKEVANLYQKMNKVLKQMDCKIESPFMTLSFMSLLVIPEIKIGEKGLFDYNTMKFTEE